MGQLFSNIWYATSNKIESVTKATSFSDRGSIEYSKDELHFQSKKNSITIRKYDQILLTTQRFPWVSNMIIIIVMVVCLLIIFPDILNIGKILLLLVLLVGANLYSLLIIKKTPWILIEYHDESNQVHKVYFADGSLSGWGGIFGGTSKLFNVIKNNK